MKDKNCLRMLSILGAVMVFVYQKLPHRTPEHNRVLYRPAFKAASKQYKLPPGLLERVAQQECSFRSDIIFGTANSAGAIGIMQIVPKWHPTARPGDPVPAIFYAAEYLNRLHNRFGNWRDALAGYNAGPTRVAKYLTSEVETLPTETINYVNQIIADVDLS